jgi:hypothetical protein
LLLTCDDHLLDLFGYIEVVGRELHGLF